MSSSYYKKATAIAESKGKIVQNRFAKISSNKISPVASIPLLVGGVSTNILIWKKRIHDHLLSEYGDLARFIELGAYFVPPSIEYDHDLLLPENDPHGLNRDAIKERIIERQKSIAFMKAKRTPCFGTLMSCISTEVENTLKTMPGANEIASSYCPLRLYIRILEAITNGGQTCSVVLTSKMSRDRYYNLRQESFETIAEFQERFVFALQQALSDNSRSYSVPGDEDATETIVPFITEDAAAVDFMSALDPSRYTDFVASVKNGDLCGASPIPRTVQLMFDRASQYVVPVGQAPSSGGAMFLSIADDAVVLAATTSQLRAKQHGKDKVPGKFKSAAAAPKTTAHVSKRSVPSGNPEPLRCWGCDGVGHLKAACPNLRTSVSFMIQAALRSGTLTKDTVILDSGANVSRFCNPDLLSEVRPETSMSPVTSFGGEVVECTASGYLDGFARIGVSETGGVNALSLDQVERLMQVTYRQGVEYVLHTTRGKITFAKDALGLYSANFRDWKLKSVVYAASAAPRPSAPLPTISKLPPSRTDEDCSDTDMPELEEISDSDSSSDDGSREREPDSDDDSDCEEASPPVRTSNNRVNVTLAQRRARYTVRELKQADEAWQFIIRGNLSKAAAIDIVENSADLAGCQITAASIRTAFEINEELVAAVKGRTTREQPDTSQHELTEQPDLPPQTIHSDVFFVRNQAFLLSVATPLGLTMVSAVQNQSISTLCTAVTDQVNQLGSYRVRCQEIRVDRHGSLSKLSGRLPNIKVDVTGAGDHVERAENKIRTVKEKIRAAAMQLPYRLPVKLIKDLVYFCVKRLNAQPGVNSTEHRCPRVRLTKVKIDFDKEYRVGFGEYVEARNPAATSNDALEERTESCVSLWPVGNRAGSWTLFSLRTGNTVVRSQFRVLPTPQAVIDRMNQWHDAPGSPSLAAQPPLATSETAAAATTEPPKEIAVPTATTVVQDAPMETRAMHVINHLTLRQAENEHGDKALAAIDAELRQLLDKGVFLPVQPQDGKGAISSSMFLKAKYKPDGSFDKLKARLVANGSQQDASLFENNSSPTVSITALFASLAVGAADNCHASVFDIGGAYLNAELPDKVVMRLDRKLASAMCRIQPSFTRYVSPKSGSLLVQLLKALYGLKQSGKLWYDLLTEVLLRLGYVRNEYDACVFYKRDDLGLTVLLLYVDDILLLSPSKREADRLHKALSKKFEEVKRQDGPSVSFLGMSLSFETDQVCLSMRGYETDLMNALGEKPPKHAISPSTADLFEIGDSPLLNAADQARFHTLVAKCLYLAKRTRGDILTAVAYLTTRVQEPTERDKDKLIRLIRYVSSTVGQELVLSSSKPCQVIGMIDASYALHPDARSHTGLVITLGVGAIVCMSSKQKIVTKSSTEAELIGLTDKIGDVIWVGSYLACMGQFEGPVVIGHDNKSALSLCSKGSAGERTKHLKVRHFFIKELIDSNAVVLVYVPTGLMVADLLTKPLQGALFKTLRGKLLGVHGERMIVLVDLEDWNKHQLGSVL